MKQPVKMPALSDTMESGRLLRWLKQAGDAVERGEAVAEIETDKAVMEMETFHSGTLIGPLADEDKDYTVGETLAWIGDEAPEKAEGQQAEENAGPAEGSKKPATDAMPSAQQADVGKSNEPKPQQLETSAGARDVQEPPPKAPRAQATPRPSSGVLEQALAGRPSPHPRERSDANATLFEEIKSGPPFQIEPQRELRRVIAATVSRAVETPQFRISMQSDLSAIKSYAVAQDASFTLLLARACALTVQEQPELNAAWTPDGLARRERVDVGIAMEAENGLLTPVVRDAAGRPFPQLAEDWRALKQKIRDHRALPEDFAGRLFICPTWGCFRESCSSTRWFRRALRRSWRWRRPGTRAPC